MKRRYAFAPAAAWALIILLIGSLPSVRLPPSDLPLDKVGHFAMFAVLGALLAYGLHRGRRPPSIGWALLAGALIGVADELHQRSVPGRSADWRDLVADVIGCALALWLAHHALDRRERRAVAAANRISNTVQEHRA